MEKIVSFLFILGNGFQVFVIRSYLMKNMELFLVLTIYVPLGALTPFLDPEKIKLFTDLSGYLLRGHRV